MLHGYYVVYCYSLVWSSILATILSSWKKKMDAINFSLTFSDRYEQTITHLETYDDEETILAFENSS